MHLKGTLVPLPYVLVCADVPVSIPFVRFDQPSLPTQCTVHCGNASFPGSGGEGAAGTVHAQARLCSTSGSYVGTFEWTAGASASAPTRVALPVNGPVRIAAQRSMWGMQTIQAVWESTQRPAEVALVLGVPGVRVQSATVARSPLAHTVLPVGSGSEVRISARRGRIEVVLEADEAGAALVLPCFPGGSGEVSVELVGDRWEREYSTGLPGSYS
jgi:hypothetical protein